MHRLPERLDAVRDDERIEIGFRKPDTPTDFYGRQEPLRPELAHVAGCSAEVGGGALVVEQCRFLRPRSKLAVWVRS